MNFLYVALGSAAGGVVRWLISGALYARFGMPALTAGRIPFPVGTLVVNVAGSFLLGVLAVIAARPTGDATMIRLLLMVGFCGGFTTMSTFSLDTVALLEQGSTVSAALYVFGTLALAFGGTITGMLLTRALLGRYAA